MAHHILTFLVTSPALRITVVLKSTSAPGLCLMWLLSYIMLYFAIIVAVSEMYASSFFRTGEFSHHVIWEYVFVNSVSVLFNQWLWDKACPCGAVVSHCTVHMIYLATRPRRSGVQLQAPAVRSSTSGHGGLSVYAGQLREWYLRQAQRIRRCRL